MTLGVMQPYFFPYIGYWQLLNAVDVYVIYDDVNYIKKGWIDRNRILCQGEPSFIKLPIKKVSQNALIRELYLVDEVKEREKILRSISLNYAKAPYFSTVYPLLEEILLNQKKQLAEFLSDGILKVNSYLEINTKVLLSSNVPKDCTLKGQDKILAIAKSLGADKYINAIGGMCLYQKSAFAECGIDLQFLKTNSLEYRQFKNEFCPNLSIIDVMMFNSKEQIQTMLNQYSLEEGTE